MILYCSPLGSVTTPSFLRVFGCRNASPNFLLFSASSLHHLHLFLLHGFLNVGDDFVEFFIREQIFSAGNGVFDAARQQFRIDVESLILYSPAPSRGRSRSSICLFCVLSTVTGPAALLATLARSPSATTAIPIRFIRPPWRTAISDSASTSPKDGNRLRHDAASFQRRL